MAEAAFKQMIATCIRQTRPQTFRHGKPPRYPQRSLATAATANLQSARGQGLSEWRPHSLSSEDCSSSPSKTRLQNLRAESEPRPFSSFLTDNYAREHNYLRISLTERCNLRCLYCMPEEGIQLSPPDHILTTPEIVYLSSLFVEQGVNKIRLTGGEPTVRKDILDLMRQIGQLRSNGLQELCLTTNGISLHRKLDSMVESGLTGVNLSLDTLDPFQFTIMTRRNGHEAVMKSIHRILDMNKVGAGIKLKINCVVMRGLNDKEIVPFVELGKEKDLEVRFIEYMPFDGNKWSQNKMLGYKDMLARIREKHPDVYKVQDHKNDTSKTYKVPGFAGRIGFITSMTHNFCGTCNRLRITSDGNLKVCLFGNSEVSLRDILRESNNGRPINAEAMEAIKQIESDRKRATDGNYSALGVSEQEARLLDVIGMAVKRKKEKHAGMGELENMKNRPMILIDDASYVRASQNAYRTQSLSRAPSPLLSVRSSPAFSRSTPVHLWSHGGQPSMFQQHRYRSTFLSRRTYITRKRLVRQIFHIPTHRWIKTDLPDGREAVENIERKERAKQAFTRIARRITKNIRYATRARQETSDEGVSSTTPSLSHLTSSGAAHMVDVGHKNVTHRSATAMCQLLFSSPITYRSLTSTTLRKGDALAVARIAGIQAAKKTADLIPLAHPSLGITAINIDIEPFMALSKIPRPSHQNKTESEDMPDVSTNVNSNATTSYTDSKDYIVKSEFGGVRALATVECYAKTGVEMEALTAANVAILTMYDMLKGVDKAMLITGSRVIEKRGGKSGSWRWNGKEKKIEKFGEKAASTSAVEAQLSPSAVVSHSSDKQKPSVPNSSLPQASASAEQVNVDDNNAQSIFEAEWANLSTSFSSNNPISAGVDTDIDTGVDGSLDSNTSTKTPKSKADDTDRAFTGQSRLSGVRKNLSGEAYEQVDAAGFRNVRIQRYEEWWKEH